MIDALIQFILKPTMVIMYLSAIETLICHSDIEFNRVYFLLFGTKYVKWFLKYRIEHIVALSSTNDNI